MKARTMQEIGKTLAELREGKGLSQEELAQAAKVTLNDIEKIESGSDASPSIAFLRVLNALGVKNPDEIIYE